MQNALKKMIDNVNDKQWDDHGLNMNFQENKILNYKILLVLLQDHEK
jgi:hypothetical protein